MASFTTHLNGKVFELYPDAIQVVTKAAEAHLTTAVIQSMPDGFIKITGELKDGHRREFMSHLRFLTDLGTQPSTSVSSCSLPECGANPIEHELYEVAHAERQERLGRSGERRTPSDTEEGL